MRDHITPSTYVSLYILDDCVPLIFGEVFMSLFLGPLSSLSPVTRTEKEVTWHAIEAKNKLIGPVWLHPNGQARARSPPLASRWSKKGPKMDLYL